MDKRGHDARRIELQIVSPEMLALELQETMRNLIADPLLLKRHQHPFGADGILVAIELKH